MRENSIKENKLFIILLIIIGVLVISNIASVIIAFNCGKSSVNNSEEIISIEKSASKILESTDKYLYNVKRFFNDNGVDSEYKDDVILYLGGITDDELKNLAKQYNDLILFRREISISEIKDLNNFVNITNDIFKRVSDLNFNLLQFTETRRLNEKTQLEEAYREFNSSNEQIKSDVNKDKTEIEQNIDEPNKDEIETEVETNIGYQGLYPEMYVDTPELTNKNQGKKVTYFTFDDGPSSLTENIIDTLNKNNIKGTFFIVGSEAEKRPEIVKKAYDSGHMIGVHCYVHEYSKVYESVESYLEDFHKTYEIIYDITGQYPYIFRFPGGSNATVNKSIRSEIIAEMTRRGFVYYDWSAYVGDADGKNSNEYCINMLKESSIYSKSILLCHDNKKVTGNNIQKYIDTLKSMGYEFDVLDGLSPTQFVKPSI